MSIVNSAQGCIVLVLGALSSHGSILTQSRLHRTRPLFQLEYLVQPKPPLLLRVELHFQFIYFHLDCLKAVQLFKVILLVERQPQPSKDNAALRVDHRLILGTQEGLVWRLVLVS